MDALAQGFSWCFCDCSGDPARSQCCGGKIPGGPLDSDEFERKAHKEIAELKARSRIRQLEEEQQKNQPTPTEEMTTKLEQQL